MTETDLCAGCLRDNEEEKAEFWCCDCGELVCRGCGKAHRRFAPPHDVVRLDEVSDFKREVPTECLLHDKKKLSLFCVGHDKLICHECLIKEHSECKKVMETVKAAEGVKSGSAIIELKRGMEKSKDLIAKYKNEHKQKQVVLIENEQTSIANIKKLQNELNRKCEEVQTLTVEKYHKSKEEMSQLLDKMEQIEQKVNKNLENISQLEGATSEVHTFQAVKYLDKSLRKGQEELNNIVRNKSQSLDVFVGDFKLQIDAFFESLNPKKQIINENPSSSLASGTMSQVKTKTTPFKELLSVANELIPLKRSEYIATYKVRTRLGFRDEKVRSCCFINENQLLVIVSSPVIDQNLRRTIVILLRKIDGSCLPTNASYIRLNIKEPSSCSVVTMYNDRLALVAHNTTIVVVDYVEFRECRNIQVSAKIIWIQVIDKQIYIIVESPKALDVCTVDFNGKLTKIASMPRNLSSVDIDNNRYLYVSHVDHNKITGLDLDSTFRLEETLYESIDLQNGCLLQYLPDSEVLLLEKSSGIMYKLNKHKKIRTVLLKDVTNAVGLHANITRKLLAVIKQNPNEIEIYSAVITNKR